MKDTEEKEQNSVPAPPVVLQESPCEKNLEQPPDEVDSTVAGNVVSDDKEPAVEVTQGALGQVKAKVEVCKDESIGKWS